MEVGPDAARRDDSTSAELSFEAYGAVPRPMTPEPPPPWLTVALGPVLHDLLSAEDALTLLGYVPDDEIERFGLVLFQEPNGSQFGFGVGNHEGAAALHVRIAERLQDNLPEVATSWGEARPRCPGHPHPARPVEHDRAAWWSCPKNQSLLVPIGQAKELAN
jgi:hypothetical protein